MNDQVRFAKKRDVQSIQKYLKKNWSKNHIFTKDENLFLWQHKHIDEKKLNFVIAINKNDQICGLMGFITSNFTKFNPYSPASTSEGHSSLVSLREI